MIARLGAGALATALALGALLTAGPSAPAEAQEPATCASTFDAVALRDCVDAATSAYVGVWTTALAARGVMASPPRIAVFRSVPVNPCVDGSESDVAVASFWCSKDSTVYVARLAAPWWTRGYAREAARAGVLAADARTTHRTTARLRRGFALQGVATELAHELGHWVQQQAGIQSWYETRIASADFRTSDAHFSAFELSADCLAGWVQGRAAATGAWRDSALIRWAQHATIAELGGDLSGMRPGFGFPRDVPLIAHGGPYSRLRLYDRGAALGRAAAGVDPVAACARAAARYTGTQPPPTLRSGYQAVKARQ